MGRHLGTRGRALVEVLQGGGRLVKESLIELVECRMLVAQADLVFCEVSEQSLPVDQGDGSSPGEDGSILRALAELTDGDDRPSNRLVVDQGAA